MYLRKVETLVLGQLSSRSLACKFKDVLRGNKHVIKTKALYLRLKHQIIALSPFSSLCKCHNPRGVCLIFFGRLAPVIRNHLIG